MKFLSLFILVFASTVFGHYQAMELNIIKGSMHKGGKIEARIVQINDVTNSMDVSYIYIISKKSLTPIPSKYLTGEGKVTIPSDFQDERGYLDLEVKGERKIDLVTLKHMGRVTIKGYNDCPHVRLKTADNDSETHVYFHPDIPELGWVRLKIILRTDIPVFSNYTVVAEIE